MKTKSSREGVEASLQRYEAWLATETDLERAALRKKHAKMATSSFAFLRGSLPRWCEQWSEFPELGDAPVVPSVGDAHLDNFGTWRDAEQRLIWGVNDFDEAYPLPYTQDLVRLATSARVAIADGLFRLSGRRACAEILRGYSDGLAHGGRPFVLEERNARLRALTHVANKYDPPRFWNQALALPRASKIRKACRRLAREHLGVPDAQLQWHHREGGLGGLGRTRVVAIADASGGLLGREFKALVPSAWAWVRGRSKLHVREVHDSAIRARDPAFDISDHWITRRFGPGTARIDLDPPVQPRDVTHLLRCMGFEIANVHLADPSVRRSVRRDLSRRADAWLQRASHELAKCVARDFGRFARRSRKRKRPA
jgi:Uncharacterized protein conserved in bacteria (DUF2252)